MKELLKETYQNYQKNRNLQDVRDMYIYLNIEYNTQVTEILNNYNIDRLLSDREVFLEIKFDKLINYTFLYTLKIIEIESSNEVQRYPFIDIEDFCRNMSKTNLDSILLLGFFLDEKVFECIQLSEVLKF